ncbi:uncharacterized protein BDV14DRAFT_196954 [Aspergillus stella-maris]|uniref:uncharacterized protein n=1 Tax=Aspergillus stella-maris TaxID=1810926 RepID=UPI003CCD8FAD
MSALRRPKVTFNNTSYVRETLDNRSGEKNYDIKHVYRIFIANTETNKIAKWALGYDPKEDLDWTTIESKTFKPGSPEFNALLYTPNGRGIGWLLLQHKTQLGVRAVSEITVTYFGENLALYFRIDPVDTPAQRSAT